MENNEHNYWVNRMMADYFGLMGRQYANTRIKEIQNEIKMAGDVDRKRTLIREMGKYRDDLYESTNNPRHRRLAERCYKVSQTGWRK